MVACLHAIEIRKAKFFVEPDHHLANKIRHARIHKSTIVHTHTHIFPFELEDGAFVPSSRTQRLHGYFTKWNWNSFHWPVKRLIDSVPRPEP